tara:strand:- start:374 stop:589 length:216 start_codon:yes stop_codon:yes gene_type:complete
MSSNKDGREWMTTEIIRLRNLVEDLRTQTRRLETVQKGIQRKAWWTGGILGAVGVGVGAYIIWKILDRYGY